MELPLDLGAMRLVETPDRSTTRLMLEWLPELHDCLGLDVRDVQALAGTLLHWLADNGHDLPDLPDLPASAEVRRSWLLNPRQAPPAPAPTTPPPVSEAGALGLRRVGDRVMIDQADPWVVVSLSLWTTVQTGAVPGCSVKGDVLTLTDSDGRVVQYRSRRDAGLGSVMCERIAVSEHKR